MSSDRKQQIAELDAAIATMQEECDALYEEEQFSTLKETLSSHIKSLDYLWGD